MNKITFPLVMGQQGPAVGDLQAALLVLLERGVILPNDEAGRLKLANELQREQTLQTYRDNTTRTVSIFQQQRNIQPNGNVDERTADAINTLLGNFGLLDGQGDGWKEVVTALNAQGQTLSAINLGTDHLTSIDAKLGTLSAINLGTDHLVSIDAKIGTLGKAPTLSLNMHGEAVKDLHTQLMSLGVTLPASETTDSIFGVGTHDALLQLQAKYDLARTGIFDDASRNALAIAVGNVAHPRRVEGRIFLDNGLPASNVKLRIVNKGFGEDATVLGDVEADERGFYALPYDMNGASANIEVHAFDANNGNEVRLSNPKVNADHSEVLNLVAPSTVKSQANEFMLLTGDLGKIVGADLSKLAQAQENQDRQDVSLLHQSTAWDARVIATAATAAKVSAVTSIATEALYGAFRAGLPYEPEALALVSVDAFAAALTHAKEAGVIALDDGQISAARSAFETFALTTRRKTIVPGTLSSVGDILDKASIEPAHKATFEKLVLTHDSDDAALWTEAKAQGIPDEQIAHLQLQGKLALLTLNNASLTEVLQAEFPSQDNLTQLVEKDLYQKEQWVTRLNALAGNDPDPAKHNDNLAQLIPPSYTQKELNDRLDAYANDLANKVRQSFPTHVVSRMVVKDEKDELRLGADRKAPLQTLLTNAIDKQFQLGRTPVDQFLKQQGDPLFAGIDVDKKGLAVAGVKLLTRAYQMTPNDEAMAMLLKLGFTSARHVITIPRAEFVNRYWEQFGSRIVTETVYDKSVQITSTTFNMYTLTKKIESTPPLMAISGTPKLHEQAKQDMKSLLKEYPTMASLFGSLDFCDCEHCRSVLSPAAYLVDLLRFIDPPQQDWQLTLDAWQQKHNGKAYDGPEYKYLKPYDALVQRRPDLPYLPLTCENTNTAMPYIDLVNEILEYFVAHNKLDTDAAHDTGEATSAELIAEPQNIVPRAYDILRGASYPLTLPFDLWLETIRRFCAYFETPLWQLLDTFRPSDGLFTLDANATFYNRAQIFAEYLGFIPTEYAIYTSPAMADWLKWYGYDKNTDTEALALDQLKSAKTLSRQLGVSYVELAALMQTTFVNPNLNSLVMLQKLGVSVSDVFRYKLFAGHTPFTEEEKTEFEKRLTQLTEKFKPLDPTFDAKQRLTDLWEQHQSEFKKVLLLRDPDTGCSFDQTTVLYADDTSASVLDFVKLNMFVRLWRRLGWTMEETDHALQIFLPSNVVIDGTTLGTALKTALVYLAHLKQLTELLNMGKDSRMKLLTLWADLPTKGKNSLYAQLFLTRNILKDDLIFDDPLGNYLSNSNVPLKNHLPALQAALNLTADEITQILQDGNTGDENDINKAKLSLPSVSLLYRYGLLARALKVSVSELITLKALSGLNPFHSLSRDALETIDDDYALTNTLEFVRTAQQVKASAFTINDLEYLFQHRFDPFGKYREDSNTRLAWTRTLAAQLHTIASDYAVPENANSMSDDVLRQKMSLALAPDVVETFMAFMANTVVYSAVKLNVVQPQHLDPAIYGVNGVSVSYDGTRHLQQVTHVGVLTEEEKTGLLKNIPAPADPDAIKAQQNFSDMLGDIESESSTQFKTFFAMYFDGLLKFDDFFGAEVITPAEKAEKRLRLLNTILPFLQKKLTRQAIVQAMTTQTGGDAALIETLLTNSTFLALPDPNTQSLMTRFEALGQRGLTRELFDSSDLSGLAKSKESVAGIEVTNANSARWRGLIEVPQNGAYRFYATLGKKDAEVHLRFDAVVEPILNGKAAQDNDGSDGLSGFIELKSGVLYPFTLEASNLQGGTLTLFVKGETTPKKPLSQFVLLPQAEMDSAAQAYTMLAKALQLAQGLGLSERDIRHILTHSADFNNVNWQQLPTQATDDTDKAVALFKAFVSLMNYAVLKRDLAGGGDDLIAIFERARLKNPDSVSELCQQIATLTRRKPAVVQATATQLQMTAPEHFANETRMERLWQALQIVQKFGISVASLQTWLTPQPGSDVAKDVRNTVKSRYELETWQHIAKAIFDPLRQRQRDALVAYIIHIQDLDSVEKLFEYFLIDPATEPVVQTSRLRLAISSLQTFIQRCFLNLEPRVHPSVLNSQHWSWMKRFRVWEANRKIFLFPENWLEPEWRDDKTHLYQELESSLLQGDVTNQLAEDALYVYLKKLDQLARLEIVTMYAEERPPAPPILHVIGRTYATPRQYFYRRYAYQMWTPWEPVSAEIDGDHIVAVMWRERLHLFWLTFMEKVEESAGGPVGSPPAGKRDTGVGDLPFGDLVTAAASTARGAVKRTLDIQLSWSEYFQGTWTTRESSGFGNTIDLYQPFNPSGVFVTVTKEVDPETGTDGAAWIILNGLFMEPDIAPFILRSTWYFRVVSKNSSPQLQPQLALSGPTSPYSINNKFYNRYTGSGPLSVTFVSKIVTTDGKQQAAPPAPQPILSKASGYTLLPTSNQMLFPNAEFAPLISPVFYADDIYTFYVEPSLTETTMDEWQGYTITRPSQKPRWDDYVAHLPSLSPVIPLKYQQEVFKQPNLIAQPDPIDPLALHAIKPNLDAVTQPGVAVQFGDAIVGRTGRMQDLSNLTQIITSVAGNNTLKL